MHKGIRVLIVDDEEELRELYSLILATEFDIDPTEAKNGSEAIKILCESGQKFDLIVSDYNMPNGNGEMVFKKVQELGIPFILVTSDRPEEHPIFKGKELTAYLLKPFSEESLFNAVRKLMEEGRKYIYIPLQSLLRLKIVSVPIYFELSANKFIKVINPGDVFDQASYDHWSAKNVNKLLVKKEDFEGLVGDFKSNLLNEMFFKSNEIQGASGLQISSLIGEVVNSAAKLLGINNEVLDLARKNIELINNIVLSNSELKNIFENQRKNAAPQGVACRRHLTAVVSNWIAQELMVQHPRMAEILTLAAFFHDVGLDDEIIKNQRQYIESIRVGGKMNKNEVEKVKVHIDKAIEMLSQCNGAPKDVLKIVTEHHELPDGSGFPKGLKANEISDISAVFIVIHEFIDLYFDPRQNKQIKTAWKEKEKLFSSPPFNSAYQIIKEPLER